MSLEVNSKRKTIKDIILQKDKEPLVCLTAYTAPMASLLDENVDLLLVGDSVGMVVYGMPDTLGVTLDMMIAHGKAVASRAKNSCVIVDMPFGSYQESPEAAFRSCARVMAETGCDGVKLEGGQEMAETIDFLVKRGIPVMGHIGLKPQSVNTMGGFKVQGRKENEIKNIKMDARAVCKAGVFAFVIEGVVEDVAEQITKESNVPTVGIGASPACDGQILVTDDMLGMFDAFKPRFVKRYANLSEQIAMAAKEYALEVRERRFPAEENCFKQNLIK